MLELGFFFLSLLYFSVLREQWIRAKYERQEFAEQNKLRAYSSGTRVALRNPSV